MRSLLGLFKGKDQDAAAATPAGGGPRLRRQFHNGDNPFAGGGVEDPPPHAAAQGGLVLSHPVHRPTNTRRVSAPQEPGKPCLVLDMDETLIHTIFSPLGNHTIVHRPGLYTFLDATVQSYELVVFTAGTKEYADSVLNSIDPEGKYFNRRFYRSSCKFRDGVYCKDLRSVGSDLSRTIIIDNIPENYAMQPENGVPIVDFIGDEYDSALIDLLPLLTDFASPKCSVDVQSFLRAQMPTYGVALQCGYF